MGMQDIEHVVVLMLENRSFDSMLGWLYEHDAPALNVPAAKPNDTYRGLSGLDLSKYINRAEGMASPPVRGTWGYAVPGIAPGEEFAQVNMQFFGTETPGPNPVATMTGVLQDFVNVMKKLGYDEATIKAAAPMIMQTYTPLEAPVLNQLAKHYAVSDDWFASVPSQTNPNRAFLMTGTSHGLVNNGQLETDPRAKKLEEILGMGIGDDRFPESTIFNALSAAGVDWNVFWQTSYLPHKISTLLADAPYLSLLLTLLSPALSAALLITLAALRQYTDYINSLSNEQLESNYTWRLFPEIQKIPGAKDRFKKLDQFHALARAGQLPKFSYLEPYWTISHTSTTDGLKNLFTAMGNDYHPPGNLVVADNFVKDVYASLIANPEAWKKTLLVITFDEFVGSFDHARPPVATPPWGKGTIPPFTTNGFAFDRFGARVPAILVSPWVQKGTVFRSSTDVPFDHTSVIATTMKWLGQDSRIAGFGDRAIKAPTFETALTLSQPRTDARDLGFLDVGRNLGDPVRFDDLLVLKNQHGKYLSSAARTMKVGTELPSSDLMGFAVDLDLAAYFPTLGSTRATLAFKAHQENPPSQIPDGAALFVATQENIVNAANFLGAWSDSHDCYYYNNYVQGGYIKNQTWIVKQVDRHGKPLCYGDKVYLESSHFAGQRLSQDTRLGQSAWISTAADGDYWTIEPAVDGALHFAGPLTASSSAAYQIDVFGLDAAGAVLALSYDATWHQSDLGSGFSGARFVGELAACAWGADRRDVFGLDAAGNVLQLWYDGTWHWTKLGNGFKDTRFVGPLTACSWGPKRIDVLGLDAAGNVLQLWYDGTWHWTNLGNGFKGTRFARQLTACSWGANRIDVLGLDASGNVLQLKYDGAWHWVSLGNGFQGTRFAKDLAACSWSANRIDVLGVDASGNVLQLWYDKTWHWDNLGNKFAATRFAGPLAACSWGSNRIDVFGGNGSGNVLQLWYDGTWHWERLR